MDLYEQKEHIISSDEYSDDDDDDDVLMNDAVKAQNHNLLSTDYTNQNKKPKWRIDQKQKELSSLIRRNKFFVIYKNKSIKWLNNKKKRERYKERIYLIAKNSAFGHITSTNAAPFEQEQQQNPKKKSIHQNKPNNKQIIGDNRVMQNISTTTTLSGKDKKKCDEKWAVQKESNIKNIDNLGAPIEKAEEIPEKKTASPSIFNENIEDDIRHTEKKFRAVSPQFYKSLNDMFPKYNKIATHHIDTIASTSLSAVEDIIKNLSNEIDTLHEILQAKEMEWNRLLHLKMMKEEIRSRLSKKWHILQLQESFSKKQDQNILLELKEMEFYLSEKEQISEVNHSSVTIQKLIENRANMNADDLKREKNNTSRLHSLLVSQNMLNSAQPATGNGESSSIGLRSKNCEIFNNLNRDRQGEVRDVKTLIADFRQNNPELLPRVSKRIKPIDLNVQHQDYSIPLFDKTSRAQYITKGLCSEIHPLQNSVHEISITPICRSKNFSSNDDFLNTMNNHHNIRSENNCFKTHLKGDFDKKCPNIPYPLCQECKRKESRFVCAGCGNQWYCSKKCQISAWDEHSEKCTE